MAQETNSNFDGGLLGLIGVNIASFFITLFTLGLGAPWAICYKEGWYVKHTTICGKRLKFIGTGGNLFVQYIKWFLLSIITIGIYSFWMGINLKKWVVKNTTVEQ